LIKKIAIELEDYDEKESLLHEIFSKHQVGNSELFALDQDLVRQLLLSFDGNVIYPEKINKEKEFDEIAIVRKQGTLFNFYKKGLKNWDKIKFVDNENIVATIIGEPEVEYGGQIWKLSPLTYKLYAEMNKLNTSGAYQGAAYFKFNWIKLKDLPDKY